MEPGNPGGAGGKKRTCKLHACDACKSAKTKCEHTGDGSCRRCFEKGLNCCRGMVDLRSKESQRKALGRERQDISKAVHLARDLARLICAQMCTASGIAPGPQGWIRKIMLLLQSNPSALYEEFAKCERNGFQPSQEGPVPMFGGPVPTKACELRKYREKLVAEGNEVVLDLCRAILSMVGGDGCNVSWQALKLVGNDWDAFQALGRQRRMLSLGS